MHTPPNNGPTAVRIPTRAEVRALVMHQAEEQHREAQRGGNVHQVALDHMDKARQYAAALEMTHGPDAAADFLTTWQEETTAVAAHLDAKSARLEARAARRAEPEPSGVEEIGKVVGPIVLVLVVVWFLFVVL